MREDLKVFPDLDYENMPFALECFGISYCDETYLMQRTCADQTVVEYVISGTGTIETPSGILHPRAGDSYLLVSNEPHKYYADPDDPWVKIWVNFQGSLIVPILNAYGLNQSRVCEGMDLSKFIRRVHAIASSDTMDINEIMNKCGQIFLEICQYISSHTPVSGGSSHVPRNIALLKEYLDNNIGEHLSLEKCVEITYLSVSQTIRSFHNAYGMTPYEYLNQRRINTAKLLLRNSTLSIEEIATQTGFTDHNYFSKYFKKKVGVSPSRFRKQQQ